MKSFALIALPLLLAGCISFHSSSETPAAEHVDPCLNKESQCREICGDRGVQSFSCSARPGEGINLKCECRRAGVAM